MRAIHGKNSIKAEILAHYAVKAASPRNVSMADKENVWKTDRLMNTNVQPPPMYARQRHASFINI